MKPIIKVENLSKQYIIGGKQESYSTFRESLVNTMRLPLEALKRGNRKNGNNSFWALKDINFEVMPGEVVGIIGRNGAGKSTLLKILSRITQPTKGRIELYGRVGSLLEVGTGFHPELTGRENIYLNGAILGMKREEIAKKFDEIVDFAEIENFLDTPVKRYSSGMYTRLAFAVAANLDPEVLIVDEVLSVGDINFQKKCLGKMSEVARGGRTVLFVSHNMAAVKSLCRHAIILEKGELSFIGDVQATVDHYLYQSNNSVEASSIYRWNGEPVVSENKTGRILSIKVLNEERNTVNEIDISSSILFEIEYDVLKSGAKFNLTLVMYSQEGVHVFSSPSSSDELWYQRPHPKGQFRSYCKVQGNLLNQGRFDFTLLLVENGTSIVDQVDKLVSLDLIDLGGNKANYYGNWGGVVRPLLQWQTEFLQTKIHHK